MNRFNVFITVKKELRSMFRDKKTISMILGFPLLIGFFVFLFGFMEESLMGLDSKVSSIGINYELDKVSEKIMEANKLEAIYYSDMDSLSEAYKDGKIDGYVYYKDDMYTIYSSDDINSGMVTSSISSYLDQYNKYLGDSKLESLNIDSSTIYNNINYEIRNIDGKSLNPFDMVVKMVYDLAFTYIIMAIAMSCVSMATSAIAVEKENGTLETILTLPVTTNELIVGKYIATVVIGFIASLTGLFVTCLSLYLASLKFNIYEEVGFGFSSVLNGILVCLVASLVIGALSIFVTSNAKSYKEAQASGQILQVLAILPMFLSYFDYKITSVTYFIPVLNYTTMLMDLFKGNVVISNLLITVISSIVYSIVLIFIIIKKFKSEKVLFNS